MKNKHSENSKQKIIIICAIIVISIIIVGGFFITKQIRVKQAQKKVDEAPANLKNTLNGGISNEGKNSISQDAIDYILEVTFIAISDIIKGGNSYRVN